MTANSESVTRWSIITTEKEEEAEEVAVAVAEVVVPVNDEVVRRCIRLKSNSVNRRD